MVRIVKEKTQMLQISEKDRDTVVAYIFNSNPRNNTVGEVNGLVNHLNALKPILAIEPVKEKTKPVVKKEKAKK